MQKENWMALEKLNNIGQRVLEMLNDIINKRQALNYKGVAQGLIETYKTLDQYKRIENMTPDQEKRLADANNKAQKFFKAIMNAMAFTNAELICFAYELRMQDSADDLYTNFFLD